ncbi:MAG: class II D-tagatose-bisphosphate aldolase, non-catalytic subunit [Rhodobacteraceae bacterium]|nr:class II D-tagatose-bisphosphate aldolase, non-catalytic subunit [Paracoccaceae bacterium]
MPCRPRNRTWLHWHFSYSDRIRHGWPTQKEEQAAFRLRQRLDGRRIPDLALRKYLPKLAVRGSYGDILMASVQDALRLYECACISRPHPQPAGSDDSANPFPEASRTDAVNGCGAGIGTLLARTLLRQPTRPKSGNGSRHP